MESGQFICIKESFLRTDLFAKDPSLIYMHGNVPEIITYSTIYKTDCCVSV